MNFFEYRNNFEILRWFHAMLEMEICYSEDAEKFSPFEQRIALKKEKHIMRNVDNLFSYENRELQE